MTKNKSLGIRVDDALRYKLKYIAEYDGRSLNNMVTWLLRRHVAEFEKEHGPILNEQPNP